MGFLDKITGAATFGIVGDDVFGLDLTGAEAAKRAAGQANAGTTKSIAEQRRQFDLTRQDLLPFLTAATGEGGALEKFVSGIDEAPTAPQLEKFQFDRNDFENSDYANFVRDQGNVAADRLAGKNRQLGSGNRLLAAQEYGQNLSSGLYNDEFGRQLNTFNTNNNVDLSNYSSNLGRFNDRLNRLGGLVDSGRGTGSTLGQIGAGTAQTIGSLQQNIGNANASATAAGAAGKSNLLNMGFTAAGALLGGPGGGSAANKLSPFGKQNTNIGFSPNASGFFA